MKGKTLRALVALALAGAAALFAVKTRERRRALAAGPLAPDPPDDPFAERNMGDVATGEGMPDGG
jgi:hypothetical protein